MLKKLLAIILIMSSLCVEVCAVNYSVRTDNYQTAQVAVSKNQQNMVARADWCYNITWVAQETIGSWGGTFNKGGTYRIPYGQPIMSGKYIGYGATFEEFIEAAATAGSIFYTGRSWCDGPTAPYYATDCSSFVSWVWGINRTTTYYIPNVTTNLGYVTTDRATYTLQLGDALNSSSHVVMVTGLEYDNSGAITRIEITEQTPPQMKRSYYSPYQLYNKYSQYTIQRYYGEVPACPGVEEETWIEKATFDPWVYQNRYDDLKGKSEEQLKAHWLNYGIKEGRCASVILDLKYYVENNPDLKTAFGTDYEKAYQHFITKGYQENRKFSRLVDGQYYCDTYPEVAASFKKDFLRHYVENGMKEGRRASATFDVNYYLFTRPDVAETWPGDLERAARHYAGYGIKEGKPGYDSQMPVISDVAVTDISAAGYTVTCKITDNWGLKKVAFPTWTVANDQDDLPADFMNTQQGTKNGSTYTFRVKASDHNNETGKYVTHIYAVDKGGNTVRVVVDLVAVEDPVQTVVPTVTAKSFTLSFESEVLVNYYYEISDTTDVAEQGMLVFDTNPGNADITKADHVYTGSTYVKASGLYMNTTTGITPKELGDTRYYAAYVKLKDGTYVYSKVHDYSPRKYAINMLGKTTTSEKQKDLCVAMLNYGAAAQSYFGYRVNDLMNAGLTAAQKARVVDYSASLFTGAVAADSAKAANFTKTDGFTTRTATVSFDGAFAINYYFTPSKAVAGNMTLYIWTPDVYTSASRLTTGNASTVSMVRQSNGSYWAQVEGIPAKALDRTYYVAGIYTDTSGNSHCTGVIAYSLSKYCISKAVPGNSMQALAAATAMYGYYAAQYFLG